MDGLSRRANDALSANPDVFNYPTMSDINITTHGSDWYWAVTAVMAASTFVFIGLSFQKPRRDRIFHYITASITLVASIAYFTMASNLGYAAIPVEFSRTSPKVAGVYREIFYVRYIDWFVTTPLLLMDLLLTCGLPWPTVLYTLLLDEVMVITGLVGALVASSYKWGYFVFATVALFFIAYNVVIVGRKHAQAISKDVAFIYQVCGVWTIFLWFLYPIAWGLSEGGNVIAPDSEAVFYGILDILAKPVFGALLLWGHRKFTPRDLGLNIRDYEDEPLHEKYGANSGVNNGASNGTHNGVNNGTHNNGVLHGNANTTVANDSATTGVVGTHANQSAV